MSTIGGPATVTSGLVLELDAGNIKSYQSGSTTWYDKSGNGYNGTLTNGPTFNTGSLGSIVFDGVDDYVELNSNSILAGTTPFTIESFYRITGTTNGEIFGNYGPGYTSGNLWFAGRYGIWINNSVYATNSPLPLGTYCMTATRNSTGDIKLYINGNLNATGNLPSSIPSNINFRIGSDVNTFAEQLTGNLYTLKVYNRELSSSEVQQNFNATRARFGI